VRWRAQWPAKYWDEADVYDGRQRLDDYDAFVFQKFYLTDRAREWAHALRAKGKLLAYDLCDPDWLEAEHRRRMLEILPLFDFAVAPTELIREWLAQWLPAYVIPDRIDLEAHLQKKDWEIAHRGDGPSLIWYGFAHNAVSLEPLLPEIARLGLQLIIVSDEPQPETWLYSIFTGYWHKLCWQPWLSVDATNQIIVQHDIALNPQPAEVDERFRYKSHNKHLTAWALGLPVAETVEDLHHFLNFEERKAEAKRRLAEVRGRWDVRLSTDEWKRLLRDQGRD
jgi:hypothetical protein